MWEPLQRRNQIAAEAAPTQGIAAEAAPTQGIAAEAAPTLGRGAFERGSGQLFFQERPRALVGKLRRRGVVMRPTMT
jgi:hypothetical protein